MILTRDEKFFNQVQQPAVVHAGHANSFITWKDKKDKTLKKIESAPPAFCTRPVFR